MRRRLSHALSASLLALLVATTTLLDARDARACGGGFSSEDVSVGMDAQIAIYAFKATTTELVVLVNVPDGSDDFGVLLPVPVGTTISSTPVDAAGIALLEEETRPAITVIDEQESGGGGVPGCGPRAGLGNGDDGGGEDPGVVVSEPVDIGPITTVIVTGDSGDAIGDWLAANGFVVPEGAQSILDSYQNVGSRFVAMKRNDTASGAASLGVHMTIPGTHSGFALRMASIGASDELAITIFTATVDENRGPSAPFETLTLTEIDQDAIVDVGYRAAVRAEVDARDGRAFIAETSSVFDTYAAFGLDDVIDDGMTITRLTTIMAGVDLGEDVALDAVVEVGDNYLEIVRADAHPIGALHRTARDVASLLPFLALLALLAARVVLRRGPTPAVVAPLAPRARGRRVSRRPSRRFSRRLSRRGGRRGATRAARPRRGERGARRVARRTPVRAA